MTQRPSLSRLIFDSDALWKIIWFIVLAIGIFVVRSIFSGPLEPWDAFWKWYPSTLIAKGEFNPQNITDIPIQHVIRWGVTLPTALFIRLFGETATTYYLVPLVFSTTLTLIQFYLGKARFAFPILVLFVMMLMVDPMIMRYSTQLHVRMFASLYIMVALLCIEKNTLPRLAGAAFFVFMAYGAKETNGIIFGPTLLVMIAFRYGFKPAVAFASILTSFLLLETLVLNYLFAYQNISLGRFEILAQSRYMQSLEEEETTTLAHYIYQSWHRASVFYKIMTAATFVFGLLLLFKKSVRQKTPTIIISCTITTIVFATLTTFPFIKLDPLVPVQPPQFKYFGAMIPFLFTITCYLINEAYLMLKTSWRPYASLLIVIFSFGTAVNAYFVSPVLGVQPPTDERKGEFMPKYFRLMPHAYFWNVEDQSTQMGNFLVKNYGIIGEGFPSKAALYWLSLSKPVVENKLTLKAVDTDKEKLNFVVLKNNHGIHGKRNCLRIEFHGLFTPFWPVNCKEYIDQQNAKNRRGQP